MNRIFITALLIFLGNFNLLFCQEVQTVSTEDKYAAVIFIPFDSIKSNLNCFVENIPLEQIENRYGNKAFWISKKERLNVSTAVYLIEIDTSIFFTNLLLDFNSIKLYTMMDVYNHILTEPNNFFRRFRNKMLVLSNFSGRYKFYPVKRAQTSYNGKE